jgi:hypothetical protein
VNDKFQRLRDEVFATFGVSADLPAELPAVATEGLDAVALEDWQIRLYHLWERLKHFRPGDLDESEARDRDALAAHVQRCLGALHSVKL